MHHRPCHNWCASFLASCLLATSSLAFGFSRFYFKKLSQGIIACLPTLYKLPTVKIIPSLVVLSVGIISSDLFLSRRQKNSPIFIGLPWLPVLLKVSCWPASSLKHDTQWKTWTSRTRDDLGTFHWEYLWSHTYIDRSPTGYHQIEDASSRLVKDSIPKTSLDISTPFEHQKLKHSSNTDEHSISFSSLQLVTRMQIHGKLLPSCGNEKDYVLFFGVYCLHYGVVSCIEVSWWVGTNLPILLVNNPVIPFSGKNWYGVSGPWYHCHRSLPPVFVPW